MLIKGEMMDKSEWILANPCKSCSMSGKSECWDKCNRDKEPARKLLEYLIPMIGNNSVYNEKRIVPQLNKMLKQLDEENDDDALCDSSCELYDGRVCDCKGNCNRRQAWLKEKELLDRAVSVDPEVWFDENIEEAITDCNKGWIEWIEKFISYSESGEKESIGILWKQWQERKRSIGQ